MAKFNQEEIIKGVTEGIMEAMRAEEETEEKETVDKVKSKYTAEDQALIDAARKIAEVKKEVTKTTVSPERVEEVKKMVANRLKGK